MPNIELVYNNSIKKLTIPQSILPKDGKPQPHHFLSTDSDNLIELAGRICYDSCASTTKTRGSEDYHKHINEVNHGSVQEHMNFVYKYNINSKYSAVLSGLVNRPGVWITSSLTGTLNFVANIRAIKEWDHFGCGSYKNQLKFAVQSLAKEQCPLSLESIPLPPKSSKEDLMYEIELVQPTSPDEIWLSFYISNISRGLSHELVCHKFHTAISQRSTRYVDESQSEWSLHPLIQKYEDKIKHTWPSGYSRTSPDLFNTIRECQAQYSHLSGIIESQLINDGVDKFTAKKQSRGAARGILGNALSTEMLWSASLEQIKRVVTQRASDGADGEIRLFANKLYETVQPLYPEYFKAKTAACLDGIGYSILFI